MKGSGQDGGIGGNPLLPRTTKRRITTNLKSINNHKSQKIKLHGPLTTKELKKKSARTTRLVRTGSKAMWAGPAEKNCGKAVDCEGRLAEGETETQSWCGLW